MLLDLFDEGQNKILGAKTYADFKKELIASDCTRCALSQGRTHIVVDRGNPEASVLMIGEGPGENEDLEGKAFVGRAGRLLDRLMKDIGFDTDKDSLIVNVVKCRPPENRAPKQEEVGACIGFLKKQMELVKPRIVLLFGATALKHLFSDRADFSMKSQAGTFFYHAEYPEVQFMVLYHPAYILRDPRQTPVMEEHLRRFKEVWQKIRRGSFVS